MRKNNFNRREFIRASALATAAGAVFMNAPKSIFAQQKGKTRVVLIRNKNLLDKLNKPNADIVQQMLDDAVTTLLDINDPVEAWKSIIKPDDIVGLKTNVWRYLPTTEQVESAIQKRVIDAGVKPKNFGKDDRGILNNPIFQKATALINARPMRTHYWSGVGSLIKNYIMFVPRPSDYHDDSCADLAAIWKLPHVAGKTRLNVLVMFTPLFHGVGPHHFSPEYTWGYNGLIVGLDPVACDAVGLEIIKAKRKEFFGEDRPLPVPAKHIQLADTRHNLGTADLNKIELIKLGWKEGILI
ncbi:DUF362 domain-containing protein [Bacteroidota bacterium]